MKSGADKTLKIDKDGEALLPSVRSPKLWLVKCKVGHESETVIRLMQKCINTAGLEITSAVAVDHLQGYIYVEAEKESHVKEAIEGMRSIFRKAKLNFVPVREMTEVLSVESQSVDKARDPKFEELAKFQKPGEGTNGDIFANRKEGHFMKGDVVIVVEGDLKDLIGWVDKIEEGTVHVKPIKESLTTITFNEKELRKHFQSGDHVKVISGVQEGVTGLVGKVEGPVLVVVSDTNKQHIRVPADDVLESSSEVTCGRISHLSQSCQLLGGKRRRCLSRSKPPRGPAPEFARFKRGK